MVYQILRQNIENHVNISDEQFGLLKNGFKHKTISKKDYFLKAGAIPKHEGLVTKGMLRQYVLDKKGKEHTLYFAVKDWWVSDIYAFLHQLPATINIQAIEDSELLIISKTDKVKLFKDVPIMERLFRIMTQKSQAALQKRMVDNLMKTADQRYIDYITKYPHITKRLNNLQLASYLGISHEFLSKIKKRLR